MNLHSILHKYFGYTSFLQQQEDIIKDILNQKDVFVLMPTGGGKSLCYQLPAVLQKGVAVVISPLIALMKDQVDGLRKNGVRASFINSSMSADEIQNVRKELLKEHTQILYIAPERFKAGTFLPLLKQLKLSLFAIDEAHCISEWGHDFRPDYRHLSMLRDEFPSVPIVALTATAVPDVQRDIIAHLHLHDAKKYIASFNRKNLFYQIQPKQNTYRQLLSYLQQHKKDSGIIYCQSRQSTENLAKKLQDDGFRALPYHAGLESAIRTKHQEQFIKDDVEIIVATIAFGMGINKSNVRFVIHYDLPKNIEGYYQETGRAGRDGLTSDCILFFGYGDIIKIEHFLNQKQDEKERQIAYAKLREMVRFCESRQCRRKILLNYFGEKYSEANCGSCDNCLRIRPQMDGTIIAQKVLSCISRTGQRFGMNYIIDVLRGERTDKILQNRHEEIKTFGAGKEYTKRDWQRFIHELIHLEVLELKKEPYPILQLNEKSRAVLKGEKVALTPPQSKVEPIGKKQEAADYDQVLFEELRLLRKTLADQEHLPPYIIFHDKTLKEMSTLYPQTMIELSKISGVGEAKLDKYGEIFLEKIRSYTIRKDIQAKVIPSHTPPPSEKKGGLAKPDKTYSVIEVRATHPQAYAKWTKEDDEKLSTSYRSGSSIKELMKIFGREEGGIKSRLRKLGLTK